MKKHKINWKEEGYNSYKEYRLQYLNNYWKEYRKKERAKHYLQLGQEEYNKYKDRLLKRKQSKIIKQSLVPQNKYRIEGFKKRLKKFNLELAEYDSLMQKQNNCCAICGLNFTQTQKRNCIDHNHKTNKIRGLLCVNCNFILGYCYDDIEILKKAINYLEVTNG